MLTDVASAPSATPSRAPETPLSFGPERDLQREVLQRVPLHFTPLPMDELYRLESELAYRQDILQLVALPAGRTLKDRCKVFVKKLLSLGVRWLVMRQVEFNALALEYNREAARWNGLLEHNLQQLTRTLGSLQQQLQRLEARVDAQNAGQAQVEQKLSTLQDNLTACRLRLRRLQQPETDGMPAGASQDAPPATIDYFLFENRFRGTRESVRARQRIYLDAFRDQGKVLDVGCGRGEFVELLAAEGLPVWGIDANPEMADFCQELGLPVSHEDAHRYLDQLVDGSLGGIFSAQVVEQMTPEIILQLLRLCWGKLLKGGVLVIETVNPSCPAVQGNFYRDPSHVRPVPPELLRFLCESLGFTFGEYLFSSPISSGIEPLVRTADVQAWDITGYHDYAILVRK